MRLFYLSFIFLLAFSLNQTVRADSPFDGESFSYFGKLPATYDSYEKLSLEISFYETLGGDDVVSRVPRVYKDLPVARGEFTVMISMDRLELEAVFHVPARPAFIQIKDISKNVVFKRLPFIPAGAAQPVPDAVTAPLKQESDTRMISGLASVTRAACMGVNTAGAKFVVNLLDAKATCQSACIHAEGRSSCLRGWTIFAQDTYFEFGDECEKGATGFEAPVESRYCCCLTTFRPMPIQLESAHH